MTDQRIFENKTAAYYTLGCKLNFAETSTIGRLLASEGIRKVRAGEKADICVVNTCSVTESADKKCRQLIRKINKIHPDAFIVVTGCYAQLKPEEVSQIEGVDLVLGMAEKAGIIQHLNRRDKAQTVITAGTKDMQTFVPSCSSDDRTRHFLKVQDGCDYYCSYCTIPFARGKSRNGGIEDLVRQAEKIALQGGKEIVLTGINIGDFGKSTGESFLDLIKALDQVEGIGRYRISSIEPNLITDGIIDFVSESNRFAPHFHIPLQSGSDEVLQFMRRRYDTALFRCKIETIKQLIPDAFIGVDVIAGMRGETEHHFNVCENFIEQLPVTQLHVFSYSERPGTKALAIEPAVSPEEKQIRSKRLLDISDKKQRSFYSEQIGKTAAVLFEHTRRGKNMHGFTANYVKVETPYNAQLVNRITTVRLKGWNPDQTALTSTILIDNER
ncbi:MAG: tRNA (N(6)-L-threonylcarbamoyladenosine(37)-C(2))-methylthiotransferase MtaB [Tannerella sp.]|nr:tRNA (N(6)-L-threonylcarbamoyladenosine(37)-C(2))-methylthiotransferase MtaB [Tannerella sp.]